MALTEAAATEVVTGVAKVAARRSRRFGLGSNRYPARRHCSNQGKLLRTSQYVSSTESMQTISQAFYIPTATHIHTNLDEG